METRESQVPIAEAINRPQMIEDAQVTEDIITCISSTPNVRVLPNKLSPSLPRIEDSVEAIDAIEDVVAEINRSLPSKASNSSTAQMTFKRRTTKPGVASTKASFLRAAASQRQTGSGDFSQTKRVGIDPLALGRSPAVRSSLTDSRHSIDLDNTRSVVATAETLKKPGGTISRPAKRVSSLQKPPFQPSKSTKPITRPSFELPGDAIARKLKEKRAERHTLQASDLPVSEPKTSTRIIGRAPPIVKMTATARARLSLARRESLLAPSSGTRTALPQAKIRTRKSNVTEQRQTVDASSDRAKPSASLVPKKRISTQPLTSSVGAPEATDSALPSEPLGGQGNRGKAVFERARLLEEEREAARKKQEAASRKARVDAAERGRIASREWAAKQRLNKPTGKEKKGNV